MKNAEPKEFLRVPVGGVRYSRSSDTSEPTAPTLAQPEGLVNGLSVAWINGIDPDSGIASAAIETSPAGAGTWTRAPLVDYDAGRGRTTTVSGLSGAQPYDVRVANINGAGIIGPWSAVMTATTLSSDAALEPGIVSIVPSEVTVNEGGIAFTVAVQRTGAGANCPAIEVDWSASVTQGGPTPANGTLAWGAGDTAVKLISATTGSVTSTQAGTIQLVAARALTGTLQPTIGSPASVLFTIRNVTSSGLKWNPGFYMGSNQITFPDDRKLVYQQAEMNVLFNTANVLGWKEFAYPACFQGADVNDWDFSKAVRSYQALAARGKRYMLCLLPQHFQSGTKYAELIPPSIYNSSAYGASPIAGKYGWWTMNGGTAMTLAWWRENVMNWVISWFQRLAAESVGSGLLTFDTAPYFEQTAFGETSMGVDSNCPDFSYRAAVDQYKRLIHAINITWPTTIHMCNNNYTGTIALAQELTDYCASNRTALGGPDTYVPGQKNPPLTNGQAAALGVASGISGYNGPDLRGTIAMMSDTQSPEISLSSRYRMYTPITFFNQVNNVLRQAHMVVTYVAGSGDAVPAYPTEGVNTGSNPGNWGSWAPVFNGNTLTHTAKPSSIP